MSLINKMLQDLDARGTPDGQGGLPGAQDVRPVPLQERGLPRGLLAGGALALSVIVIALAWVYLKRPELPPVLVNVATTPPAAPVPAAAPEVVAAAQPVVVPVAIPAAAPVETAPASVAPVETAPVPPPAAAKPARPSERVAPHNLRAEELQRIGAAKEKAAPPKVASVAGERLAEGKQVTPQQRIDNGYRRALAYLQDGRIEEAMAGLQQTLALDPRHQGARETLVRLLLEAQRPDEAVSQLQQSLNLDPKQPAQAMTLARLQLDRSGAAALDTLRRTLPYAQEHGDYRALYAGVLQREQRYRDAAEQYQAALQSAPDNSVWWMGLGIALQADNQPAPARQAFERAKSLQTLSPQLQAFVERKLVQLAK
ncbi:tetratricopeptide repeat protein [Janthinobacterium aquaticum]|uniref:tetratricopeptide repeat protein n=1 Tax=Janthinobacterium sp. FT58W TaxID=2654254 RepID=UPI0012653A55|nr:tetratricopeptide repeat protein [Janthinobacterium sp. FT58W]KAB8044992.1 tetratricopeptide repeat protein [Janthinobacterium sp. FT58W]